MRLHELPIDERLERLAREHPGSVLQHRLWYQSDADETHHILQFTDGAESWSAVGTSLGAAYCELRRKMVIGESKATG
jgi:hypothetical protein